MNRIHTLRKWITWLALTAYFLGINSGITLWRAGIFKYACMQEYTPSMEANMNLLHSPATAFFSHSLILLMWLNLALMFLDLRYGPQAQAKIEQLLFWLKEKPLSWLPLAILIASPFFNGANNYGPIFLQWIVFCTLFFVALLYRRRPDEKTYQSDGEVDWSLHFFSK
jgi:hypothetical protein